MPHEVILATGNAGKLREFQSLLAPLDWTLIRQNERGVVPAVEDGLTFLENALAKARAASAQTGLPALADDSGLVVDALGGAPGVHSARYAGPAARDEDNIARLLAALADTPAAERRAHFYCVIVYLRHAEDPAPLIGQGRWDGSILATPQGMGGFGYDPVFWVPERNCSAAELDALVKNRLSHRARALNALQSQWIDADP
jgi:XTP/dITP diphosphohydrolase